jgi:hypothetical protein
VILLKFVELLILLVQLEREVLVDNWNPDCKTLERNSVGLRELNKEGDPPLRHTDLSGFALLEFPVTFSLNV